MRASPLFFFAVLSALLAGCGSTGIARSPENGPGGAIITLTAPGASSVAIAGSFNRWDAASHQLERSGRADAWTIALPLPPGRYEYQFVMNGSVWFPDPAAPSVDDGLGGRNSVLIVP